MNTPLTKQEEERYVELQQMALDCARDGQMEPLASMIQAGMPVNLSDAKGNSLLMLATYHGHVDIAWMLLQAGAAPDQRNDRGQTPLGGAAFKGYDSVVRLLLEYGADANADNGGGMTPIMFAAMFGRFQVVEILQKHGASLEKRSRWGLSAKRLVSVARWIGRLKQCFSPNRKEVYG